MIDILAADVGGHVQGAGFPLLTAIVVIPAIGAALVALVPRSRGDVSRLVGVVASAATAALTIWMTAQFDRGEAGFQFVTDHAWIKDLGIHWHLGVDGISLFLVLMTGLIFPIALWGVKPHHDVKSYTAWMLLLEMGCLGTFVALDLFVFFIMFEIVLVPMYFIIGGWGYADRIYAALKFFLFTMLGSAFMLVGIITTAYLAKSSMPGGHLTFDLVQIAEHADFATNTARWLFLSFAVAFAVKVPVFPLHTWLPDAHTQAPTAGSVILAAVLLKLGTYGFLRFGLYLFPAAAVWAAPGLVTLGVIGILYGAIVAAVQKDLKRLVAYSSVAHLGFIILGTFALTSQSLTGGVVQMINHGVSTGALFLLVGMIYDRRHTRLFSELGGMQKTAPLLAAVFTVVMMSSIGLPGLNGFVGEFLILIGSFPTRRWWAVAAGAGVILAAVYLLWAFQRVFHGRTPDVSEPNPDDHDLTWADGFVLAPLLAAIVFIGVYPKPMLDRIEPSVNRLISHVEDRSDYRQPAVATKGTAVVGDASNAHATPEEHE